MIVMWLYLPLKPVTGSWSEKVRKIDWFGLFTVVTGVLFLIVSASMILVINTYLLSHT